MYMPVEKNKSVGLLKPAADAGGRTGRYVSLKNVIRAAIYAYIDQGNAATITLSIYQSTVVAGTDGKVLVTAAVVPIWANEDLATNDTMTRQTDAVNFTTSAAVKEKLVCFLIDPAKLDIANDFDCVTLVTGASDAANITSAWIECEMKYAAETPPSVTID